MPYSVLDTLYPAPHVTHQAWALRDEGSRDGVILRLKSIQLSSTFPNSLNHFKEADMNIINEQNKQQVENKSGPCFMGAARMMDFELQTCLLANVTAHSFPNGIAFSSNLKLCQAGCPWGKILVGTTWYPTKQSPCTWRHSAVLKFMFESVLERILRPALHLVASAN